MDERLKAPRDSGGIREVIGIALPLVLATSGHAIRLFSDRIMLSRFSADAIKASVPAGLTSFTLTCFFLGVAGYTNTFVAQYAGADRKDRVGQAVWQGIFLALIGGALVALSVFWATSIFRWFGHELSVQAEEVRYYSILSLFSAFPLLNAALESFWSGRGKTYVIMGLELGMAALNVLLNYLLIFGHGGLPRMGIAGAGLATGLSALAGTVACLVFFLSRANRAIFQTWPGRLFDADLFRRLVRYGFPGGVQFFLDLASFNLVVNLLARMGPLENEASNIAFSINAIAFHPMIGIGMTVGILVGQAVGARDIPHAKRSVRSARAIVLSYMAVMAVGFLFFPHIFLWLFTRPGDASQVETFHVARVYLRYVASFLLFDGLFIVYSSAIKGAGDTRFAMWICLAITWGLFAIPSYIVWLLQGTAGQVWIILVFSASMNGIVFYWRYRAGQWQRMRVIEA
ncbi:MAG: MATE family efflux transporter [Planctomycetota bacterium]